jgi:hypothetical protein
MRQYLLAHNELPEESLRRLDAGEHAFTASARRRTNNQVGAMQAQLHTNIKDPLERLAAIKKRPRRRAKAYIDTPLVRIVALPGRPARR